MKTEESKPHNEADPLDIEDALFFEEQGVNPFETCVGCGERWIDLYHEYGEDALTDRSWSNKKNGFICLGCREEDEYQPCGTVVIYDPEEQTATKYVVGEYNDEKWEGPRELTVDDLGLRAEDFELVELEESPIQFAWRSTDPWRGYYEPQPPEGWTRLHSDGILHMSADAEELAQFQEATKRLLWEAGVKFAICYGSSSNLFFTNYDIYVEAPQEALKALEIILRVSQLKYEHRDPGRYMRTALTGSSEDTEESRLLVKAYKMIEKGTPFEKVKETILEEIQLNTNPGNS